MMKTLTFKIEFLQYWHAGSGEAGTGDIDATVLRDAHGLPYLSGQSLKDRFREHEKLRYTPLFPYLPGRSLKGLFSEALCELSAKTGAPSLGELVCLLGKEGLASLRSSGCLHFSDGRIGVSAREQILKTGSQGGLFGVLSSTALENGIATNRTLRRIETSIPMDLTFDILVKSDLVPTSPSIECIKSWLKKAAELIHMAGAHRHAGLGECRVSFSGESQPSKLTKDAPATATSASDGLMRMPFKIELLDRVILGQNTATAGPHECLDHIPGAAILGAAAGQMFREIQALGSEAAFQVFHGGAVRFENAYPVVERGKATLPVPLSYHYPKGSQHHIDEKYRMVAGQISDLSAGQWLATGRQPKQIRGLWMTPCGVTASSCKRETLKSARDTARFGSPTKGKLFSYEALERGQVFQGEISIRLELLPQSHARAIEQIFCRWLASSPTISLGRSRTAEFGRARIVADEDPSPVATRPGTSERLVLFAVSDIAFETALPVLGKDFHSSLDGWKLDSSRSFTCFTRHSGWYGFLGCRLPEREVLLRGSVVVFQRIADTGLSTADIQKALDRDRVGLDIHKGFGKVLVNPDFLFAVPGTSEPDFKKSLKNDAFEAEQELPANAPILSRIARTRSLESGISLAADRLAEKFVKEWNGYSNFPSPSQWSRMRELAAMHTSVEGFHRDLEKMLDHGAAKKAWHHAMRGDNSLGAVIIAMVKPSEKGKPTPLAVVSKELQRFGRTGAERTLLAAIAEASRRLRQTKNH